MPHVGELGRPRSTWADVGGFGFEDFEVPRQDTIYQNDRQVEEKVWERLHLISAGVSAFEKKLWSSVAGAGFSVVQGVGGRAPFYASFARSMMAMEGWTQFTLDLLKTMRWGWRFFESEPYPEDTRIVVDRRSVIMPRRMRAYFPWDGAFDLDRNFILRSTGSLSGADDVTYQTNGREGFHVDQVRWMTTAIGDSSSPYGMSVERPAWLLAQVDQAFMKHFAERLPLSLGRLQVTVTDPKANINDVARQAQAVFERLAANGIEIIMPGVDQKVVSDVAFPTGFDTALDLITQQILQALTGSHLASAMGERGSQAAATVHDRSPQADSLCVGRWVGDQIKHRWVLPWLQLNGFNPSPLELPTFRTHLEPEPSVEEMEFAKSSFPKSVDFGAWAELRHIPLLVQADEVEFEPPPAPIVAAPPQESDDSEDETEDEGPGEPVEEAEDQ